MTVLAACSTDDALPEIDAAGAQMPDETRAGTLLAEFSQPHRAQPGGVSVHAQFMDVHGLRYATALEALDVWSPAWQLDIDTCQMGSAGATRVQRADKIRLHLLDVGPITVRGPSEAVRLDARRLPNLLNSFSGVIYGTEQGFGAQPLRIGYQPRAFYSFRAPGTPRHGGFDVTMAAPPPIRIASVDGRQPTANRRLSRPFSRDLRVQWQPSTTAGAVFLGVSGVAGSARARLECRLEDDGSFELPASLIAQLTGEPGALRLSLRRVNARTVDIDGLDTAEFVFSTVDDLTLIDQ